MIARVRFPKGGFLSSSFLSFLLRTFFFFGFCKREEGFCFFLNIIYLLKDKSVF